MLDLDRVTCFAIDNTKTIDDTIKALYTCMDVANFHQVKLVTSSEFVEKYSDQLKDDGIIVEESCVPVTTREEYGKFLLQQQYRHIESEFCLSIQNHAFIINPDAWMDEYYNYDYIGAPWPISERAYISPYGEHIRVGNGGFSFKSKKLMELPSKVDIPFPITDDSEFYKTFGFYDTHEDGNICVHNRHIYEEHGCKIAPLDIAKYFSYETPLSENSNIVPFGFHHNLPRGIIVEGYTSR